MLPFARGGLFVFEGDVSHNQHCLGIPAFPNLYGAQAAVAHGNLGHVHMGCIRHAPCATQRLRACRLWHMAHPADVCVQWTQPMTPAYAITAG